MKFDKLGREMPDDTPLELPAGFKVPESLESMVARLVRTRVSEMASREGMESFEEANDFEVDEDEELSPSEVREMKLEALKEEQLRLKEMEDAFASEEKAAKLREKLERKKKKKAPEDPAPVSEEDEEEGA